MTADAAPTSPPVMTADTTPTSAPAGAKEPAAAEEAETKKRSHHVSCQCMLCKYCGPTLKRHFQTHIMRGEASAEDLLIHLAISAHGKKRRGPKIQTKSGGTVPGRKIQWCSYEGYTKSTPYLHDHLKNVQGVKPKTTLMRLYLEKARLYEGRKAKIELNSTPKIKSPIPSTSKVTLPQKRPASTQPPLPMKARLEV